MRKWNGDGKGTPIENAHLRLGRLTFVRQTKDHATNISLYLNRLVLNQRRAAFRSTFGGDQEIAAISAAIADGQHFHVHLHGAEFVGSLGEKAVLYRSSLQIPASARCGTWLRFPKPCSRPRWAPTGRRAERSCTAIHRVSCCIGWRGGSDCLCFQNGRSGLKFLKRRPFPAQQLAIMESSSAGRKRVAPRSSRNAGPGKLSFLWEASLHMRAGLRLRRWRWCLHNSCSNGRGRCSKRYPACASFWSMDAGTASRLTASKVLMRSVSAMAALCAKASPQHSRRFGLQRIITLPRHAGGGVP